MTLFPPLPPDKFWFIILTVFCIAFAIQFVYYLCVYFRFVIYKSPPVADSSTPVSVIICARNEAENLDAYLPLVLTQNYPEFEVIVVNDCSSDDTEMVLNKYSSQFPNLRISHIREDKKFSHGKKLAVTLGIKAAKYPILLFIDGDCRPESNQWIRKMAAHITGNTEIVLGYGGHFPKPGLLNRYIRYDTLTIALQYFSFALCKIPYMGVGRNLAYKRSLFYHGKGFSRHYHLASGDDDLFVNEHANRYNTAIEFSHSSHTRTAPKESFEKWYFQKKRHFSTNTLYKPSHKFLLSVEPLSRLLYYSAFVVMLSLPVMRPLILLIFLARLLIQLIVLKNTMNKLHEKNLLLISLLFDIISLFINFGLLVSSRLRPTNYQWK